MKSKHTIALLAVAWLACTHARRPDPSATLQLLHEPVHTVTIGTNVEISSSLKNTGSQGIEVCTQEPVVSAWLEGTGHPFKWPIVLGGTILDAECATRRMLQPGEDIRYVSRGGISRDLPVGPAVLHLSIGVFSSAHSATVRIATEEPVQVAAR